MLADLCAYRAEKRTPGIFHSAKMTTVYTTVCNAASVTCEVERGTTLTIYRMTVWSWVGFIGLPWILGAMGGRSEGVDMVGQTERRQTLCALSKLESPRVHKLEAPGAWLPFAACPAVTASPRGLTP